MISVCALSEDLSSALALLCSALLVGNARDAEICNMSPLILLLLLLVGLVLTPSASLPISLLFHH